MYRNDRLSQMKAIAFKWGQKPHGRGAPLQCGGPGGGPTWVGSPLQPLSLPTSNGQQVTTGSLKQEGQGRGGEPEGIRCPPSTGAANLIRIKAALGKLENPNCRFEICSGGMGKPGPAVGKVLGSHMFPHPGGQGQSLGGTRVGQ